MTISSTTTHDTGQLPDPQRWRVLSVGPVASLLAVLNVSIADIALPHEQSDLYISDAGR
ncbi:hypothetical protein [Streptomyces sp. NPDC002547]